MKIARIESEIMKTSSGRNNKRLKDKKSDLEHEIIEIIEKCRKKIEALKEKKHVRDGNFNKQQC